MVLAVSEDHEKGGGKGKYTESHKTFQLLGANCGADTPGPIPIKSAHARHRLNQNIQLS